MPKITITAFEKLTTAKRSAGYPWHVTVNGKHEFDAVLPVNVDQPSKALPVLYKAPQQIDNYVSQDARLKEIADYPAGVWLGEWSGNVYDAVKKIITDANGKLVVLIAYNIPGRDNGNYSSGGLKSWDEHAAWIGAIGAAIGDASVKLILEPDALGLAPNLSPQLRDERFNGIAVAVDILKKQPNVETYIDASMWVGVDQMGDMLKRSNVANAKGFSINVSGYEWQSVAVDYGTKLAEKLAKTFVIDTARNGNGPWANPNNEKDPWANPPGRKIGVKPTLSTGVKSCDAFLWLKNAGESDGAVRGYGSAGTFEKQLALNLIEGK